MESGRKINIQPRVVAEITQSQVGQMHAEQLADKPAACQSIFPTRRSNMEPVNPARLAAARLPTRQRIAARITRSRVSADCCPSQGRQGRARHSVRAADSNPFPERRARSDAPYLT